MSNLDDEFNKFISSQKYKSALQKNITTNSKFISTKLLNTYMKDLREIINSHIETDIDSVRAIERFKDNFIIKKTFENNTGWVIEMFFNEDEVTSNSLYWNNPKYEMGAYLPVLFNNGYRASNNVYGRNNEGYYIKSLSYRKASSFINKAVTEFKAKYPDCEIEFNEIYGGDMERGNLATLYF